MPEGAAIGANTVCTVVISDDPKYAAMVDSVLSIMDDDEYKIGSSSWMEQISNAMNMEVEEVK